MKASWIFAVTACLLPAGLAGQGWIEPPTPRDVPFGVAKVRTAVSVRVEGRIARVEVEEWFQNRGGGLAEGDYLYPLPGEAVFADFSLFQGDRELKGETMDAERARAIYEEIVRRKKDPALIELAGHGLLRARVFPISAGETRRIILRYTQVMSRAGDALHFRYAAAGRFGGVSRGGEESSGPRRLQEPAPLTFTLRVDDAGAFRDPFSPTHEVRVTRADGRLTVRPTGDLSGDLSLFLPLARGLVGVTTAAHRPSSEDGYFMLTLSPGEAAAAREPRDVTVVLDVSGSMAGSKMEQARQALRQLLGSLERADRFRLIAFSNAVTAYRSDWTAGTPEELEAARRWVDGLTATGGTNIAGALEEAFRAPGAEGRLPIVVFVTDGLPSVGEQDPERIAVRAEQGRGRARVFAFGVGYDVNTYLLDRLSVAGRGTTEYVEPDEDVETALGSLAAKIRHPVLTDVEIAEAPVRLKEVYPLQLPDLFAGQELIVFGRYDATRATRRGTLSVRGRRGGRTEAFSVEAEFPEHELANDFIPRLWAARKIGVLTQHVKLRGADPEVVREIRETALRYGLLSEYTSHLVEEPELVAGRPPVPGRPGGVMRGEPAAAPAPALMSGKAAVASAESARQLREARSSMALDAAMTDAGAQAGRSDLRAVGGRYFRLRGATWTDARHGSGTRVVRIEPFGDAYFRLLRLAPELEPYWRSFERVLVAGARVSVEVAPGGEEALSQEELARVVREFRGS